MSSDSGSDVTVQSVNDPSATDAQAQAFVDATVAFMQAHEADINVALLARYFCLIGVVLLVYDNISTLPTERRLIWTARRSFTKWGFLFNRYLVPVCLLLVFLPLSGFVGLTFSNTACQSITSITAMIAVASLALGNGLIVIRVVDLWDNHKMVTRTMVGAFIVTYTITLASFVVALFKLYAFIEWNPVLNMCVLTKTTPWLIPPWAAPLVFEVAVLGATVWNVIDKPRAGNVSLKHALQRDGIIFFLVMTILRAINLGIVSSQHASTVMLGVFLIWSLVTLALNRSLLSFAKAELEDAMRAPSRSGRRSPFGIRASTHMDGERDRDDKMVDWEAGEIEVGHVEIEMR